MIKPSVSQRSPLAGYILSHISYPSKASTGIAPPWPEESGIAQSPGQAPGVLLRFGAGFSECTNAMRQALSPMQDDTHGVSGFSGIPLSAALLDDPDSSF